MVERNFRVQKELVSVTANKLWPPDAENNYICCDQLEFSRKSRVEGVKCCLSSIYERLLVVSPHLDDAAFSVGARISAASRRGVAVTVCTVFAGDSGPELSPAASAFHKHCGLGTDAVLQRRREDEDALRIIGAKAIHLDHLDAIYRRLNAEWIYRTSNAAFSANWPNEPDLIAAVATSIHDVIDKIQPTIVWTCLALGGHVDHKITRSIVTEACQPNGIDCLGWEDVPYSMDGRHLEIHTCELDALEIRIDDWRRKIRAVGQYSSQLGTLAQDGSWEQALDLHGCNRESKTGSREPLWRIKEARS